MVDDVVVVEVEEVDAVAVVVLVSGVGVADMVNCGFRG